MTNILLFNLLVTWSTKHDENYTQTKYKYLTGIPYAQIPIINLAHYTTRA
jgi:hypothetical protein